MAPRILQRVAAAETSDHVRALHHAHGVRIVEGTGLDRLLGHGGRVTAARLTDGEVLPADFVIAGVGIVPATAVAEMAGAAIDNGIAVDAQGRTSVPGIWAAGDCASFPGRAADAAGIGAERHRPGRACGRKHHGGGRDYDPQPWFWSDQYDLKLQIAGLNTGYDRVVTRGPEGGAVSFWYYVGDRLLAVDAMNDPRAYMVGKRLIEMGKSPRPGRYCRPCRQPEGPAQVRIIAGRARGCTSCRSAAGTPRASAANL